MSPLSSFPTVAEDFALDDSAAGCSELLADERRNDAEAARWWLGTEELGEAADDVEAARRPEARVDMPVRRATPGCIFVCRGERCSCQPRRDKARIWSMTR